MNVKIKVLNDKVIIPTRGSKYSAGMDLYACINSPIIIAPHQTIKINTGVSIELPHGYFGGIFARSGLATNQGLRLANCVAVIDEDYRGEWIVPLHNDTDNPQTINPMERIAQLVVIPYLPVEFEKVDELSDTERGDKGFGDSGRF